MWGDDVNPSLQGPKFALGIGILCIAVYVYSSVQV